MGNKDKTRYIGIYVSIEMHMALNKFASGRGMDLTDFTVQCIHAGLEQYKDHSEFEDQNLPPEVRVYMELAKLQSEQMTRKSLIQIARSALHSGDLDLTDRLNELCQATGNSVEDIIVSARREEEAAEYLANIDMGSSDTLQQAISWVLGVLPNGGKIKSSVIAKMAQENGISARMLDKAKIQLGIDSKKEGKSWYWIMPTSLNIPSPVKIKA